MQGTTIDVEYAGGMKIDEGFYEQVIIDHLRDDLGYEYLHGPDVSRTTPDYRDVFLLAVPPNSLRRINPGLPAAAIEQAMLKVSSIDAGSLYQKSEVFDDTDDCTMVTCPTNEEFAHTRDHGDMATKKSGADATPNTQETSETAVVIGGNTTPINHKPTPETSLPSSKQDSYVPHMYQTTPNED